MLLWCGEIGLRGELEKNVLKGVWSMAALGALGDRRRGQGREVLDGGRGYQKGEERVPQTPSAAGTLLSRPTPLDLGTCSFPDAPLPCGGWGIPAC